MLKRYRLTMEPNRSAGPKPEWGYRLYAALLETVPPGFGDETHRDAPTPISQYISEISPRRCSLCWTVTLLGTCAASALSPVIESRDEYHLIKDGVRLTVVRRETESVLGADELLLKQNPADGRHILRLITATAFKSRGEYVTAPTTRLIIQSAINKWNACFTDCQIEDEDGEGLDTLAAGLELVGEHLTQCGYRLKGRIIPGVIGELTVLNNHTGFSRQLAAALLEFSGYSGIGIKTALGMGGAGYRQLL